MAEILVKLSDNDPSGKNPGAYRPGMPVVVKPDGWRWGREEGPPKFFIVKIPGVPVEEVEKYIEEYYVERGVDEEGAPIRERGPMRKIWQFQVNERPTAARTKLQSVGEITVSTKATLDGKDIRWDDLKAKLYNHKDQTPETRTIK